VRWRHMGAAYAHHGVVTWHDVGVPVAGQQPAAVADLTRAAPLHVKQAAGPRAPVADPAVWDAHVHACASSQLKATAGDRDIAAGGRPDCEVAGVGDGERAVPVARPVFVRTCFAKQGLATVQLVSAAYRPSP